VTALLEAERLVVRREGHTTLEVPYLAVRQGEILAAVGPNGAGKTTFFMAAARLLPCHGKLLFDGARVENLGAVEYRRRLALVMQEPLLFDTSVYRNVDIGLRFRGLRKEEAKVRVARWLGRLEIEHIAEKSARKISGGEAQRVSLARAFVLEPELLLLDEPFSGLDNATRRRLLRDLRAILSETRTTTIFITHDLSEAIQIASHLAVFLGGQVCQVGTVTEVLQRPATPQIAAFLGPVAAARTKSG